MALSLSYTFQHAACMNDEFRQHGPISLRNKTAIAETLVPSGRLSYEVIFLDHVSPTREAILSELSPDYRVTRRESTILPNYISGNSSRRRIPTERSGVVTRSVPCGSRVYGTTHTRAHTHTGTHAHTHVRTLAHTHTHTRIA